MINRIFSLLIITAILVSPVLAAEFLDGRVIVRFRSDAQKQASISIQGPVSNKYAIEQLTKQVIPSSSPLRTYKSVPNLAVVKLPVGLTVDSAINQYLASGLVEYAEPDYIGRLLYSPLPDDEPDDEFYDLKWDHEVMMVREGWGYTTGSSAVNVAVLDTGVAYDHPDLYDNIAKEYLYEFDDDGNEVPVLDDDGNHEYILIGWDSAGDTIEEYSPDDDPMDYQGHGTHVAGIIGAVGNNSIGVAGVNWEVSIMPVKVFADDSETYLSSDLVAGIEWAVDNGAHIINLSLGGEYFSQTEYNAINNAGNNDVIVVAAAGNYSSNNDNVFFAPASYDLPNLVSVMSTNQGDNPSGFTNYGARTVDLAAPGSNIYSTTVEFTDDDEEPYIYDYDYKSGTSMAAPQVAGTLALMKAVIDADGTDELWPYNALSFMYLTTDRLASLSGLCVTGGRVNVFRALEALSGRITNITQALTYGFDELPQAVDEANPDDELEFSAGVFFGNVVVDKSLTFRGQDPNSPAVITYDANISDNPDDPIFTLTGALNTFYFENLIIQDSPNGAVLAEAETLVFFEDCQLRYNSTPENGAAIFADQAEITITSTRIYENSASGAGGGIYAINGSTILFPIVTDPVTGDPMPEMGSVFSDNFAQASGGAIFVQDSVLQADYALFEGNTAHLSGGAIYAYESDVDIAESEFSSNSTEDEYPPHGGGAIFSGGSGGDLRLEAVVFNANDAGSDGGAIFIESSIAQIINCQFYNNTALMDGGAVFAKASPDVTITDTVMTGNSSEFFGGAVSISNSDVQAFNMLITDNYANWWGGAIYIHGSQAIGSNLILENATIDGNRTSVHGGGIYISNYNTVDIVNTIFTKNTKYAVYESGFLANTTVNNCLFYNNPDGIFFDDGVVGLISAAQVNAMAGSDNNIGADPMYVRGRLGNYYLSHADAGQILDANGNIAAEAGTTATSPCYGAGMMTPNYNPAGLSSRTDGVDTGQPDIGYHYLDPDAPYTETENVEITVSPAAGGTVSPDDTEMFKPYSHIILEATSSDGFMFYRWTTPTGVALVPITPDNLDGDYYILYDNDGNKDFIDNPIEGVPYRIVIQIDSSLELMAIFESAMSELRIRVSEGLGDIRQNGRHEPIGYYIRGEVVNLRATPHNAQHKIRWHGTDDDSLLSRDNKVTVDSAVKYVNVQFYQPQVWTLGPQGDGSSDSIVDIMTDPSFEPGDIIQLLPGEYYFAENNYPYIGVRTIIDREVEIRGDSTNPEAVVIRRSGFTFSSGVRRNTILRDVTFDFSNSTALFPGNGYDGNTTPQNPYRDGQSGASGGGYMVTVQSGAEPTIKNVRFVGGFLRIGSGGHGAVIDEIPGDGGWPGITFGGAIRVGNYSSPLFDNCEFINLHVQGGDGGNAAVHNNWPGYPGLWGNPTDSTFGRDWALRHTQTDFPANEFKEQYAGRGGAMYIGIGATPVIRNSRFEGCSAASGSSGLENSSYVSGRPKNHYRIPSYGGAVFIDAKSSPTFENVIFKDNIAHWSDTIADIDPQSDARFMSTSHRDGGEILETNEYMSSGGAVYAQRNATPKFINCFFEGNRAVVGGAIAVDNIGSIDGDYIEYFVIEETDFVENESRVGGAFATVGSPDSKVRYIGGPFQGDPVSRAAGHSMLLRSNFTANSAVIWDEDVIEPIEGDELVDTVLEYSRARSGLGGAIAAFSSKTQIADCQFQENMSGGFGGAIYLSGKGLLGQTPDTLYSTMYLRNCLIAKNYSGIGGGGMHITTHADPQFINCTIADNAVTAAGGKGGGLLVTDVSSVSIINSILYGNLCSNGSQIALAEPHEGEPSHADIRYSLVEPYIEEPPIIDTGLKAIRTINGFSDQTIIVSDIENDIYELEAAANAVSNSIDMGFSIDFYGQTTNRVFVSDNGLISFLRPITTFNEFILSSSIDTPVIAPFHADVDTSRGNVVKYGRGEIVIEEGGQYIQTNVFFVNYIEVGYFSQRQNRLNSFQLVLIDRSDRAENDFDIEFNYGKIRWEAGENQDGVDGLGGTTARVGFSKGTGIPGTFFELEGSGVEGAFLDNSTTALIARNRKSEAMGRLVFPVKEGSPQIIYGVPVYVEGSSSINYDVETGQWLPGSNVITEDPLWAVDGFYYLSHIDAGQDVDSPAISAGADDAKQYDIYRHTTRVDNRLDTGIVDLGFHYYLPLTEGLVGDFDFTGEITLANATTDFINYWLDNCTFPYWCHGRDLNRDGIVNEIDRVAVQHKIGTIDTIPPQPMFGEDGQPRVIDFTTGETYRMTWEQKPVSVGSGVPAITMMANVAIDNTIGDIEYNFINTYGGGNSSGWQTSREYTDTGLSIDQEYAYICIARDAHGNETLPSLAVRTIAGDDSEPPITDPDSADPYKARWLVYPQTASIIDGVASIRMVAQTATDINGVEYFFESVSGNGNNSTWQDSPEYVDTGLAVGQTYTYRVLTRDKSRNQNEGNWSNEASVFTDPGTIVDMDKPFPMPFITNAEQVERSGIFQGKPNSWHRITAVAQSQDESGPVWYQFICLTNSKFTSPRIYENGNIARPLNNNIERVVMGDGRITWEVNVGFPGKTMDWKVIAGDSAPVENAYTRHDQPQRVTLGSGITRMRYADVINWIITVTEDGTTNTYFPADFEDFETWEGGTINIQRGPVPGDGGTAPGGGM